MQKGLQSPGVAPNGTAACAKHPGCCSLALPPSEGPRGGPLSGSQRLAPNSSSWAPWRLGPAVPGLWHPDVPMQAQCTLTRRFHMTK